MWERRPPFQVGERSASRQVDDIHCSYGENKYVADNWATIAIMRHFLLPQSLMVAKSSSIPPSLPPELENQIEFTGKVFHKCCN